MSLHTSALLIEGDHTRRAAELLSACGFPGKRPRGVMSGAEACGSRFAGRAIACVKGWTFVWDPMMFAPDDPANVSTGLWSKPLNQALVRLSQAHRVYSFLTEG